MPSDKPLAAIESVRGVRLLAALCPVAEQAGLRVGQKLADARAICPELTIADADPVADREALTALARWAERYTPLAAADPPDGLWLEISGCAHFFGDEAGLAADLDQRLAEKSLVARIAVAGTAGAAWALARNFASRQAGPTVLPPEDERRALSLLPVASLRLDGRTVAGLRRLGLRTVDELARQPRAEIAARFGPDPVLRLDQALGAMTEAIAWPHPPQPWEERLAFAEPIATADDLGQALTQIAERLCRRLADQESGGHRFAADFFRVDGERSRIDVATALPVHDPAYLAKLLIGKLDLVDPGFGIEIVRLFADDVAAARVPQTSLSDIGGPRQTEQMVELVDTLGNRIGHERLWQAVPHNSHIPERAVTRAPALRKRGQDWHRNQRGPRPLRLLARPEPIEATAPVPDDPPIQFRWRGVTHRVRAAAGPERISREWWLHPPEEDQDRAESDHVRDYYRVENNSGGRYWIFRVGLNNAGPDTGWFLHGLFG